MSEGTTFRRLFQLQTHAVSMDLILLPSKSSPMSAQIPFHEEVCKPNHGSCIL